jgi:hypothetical protein
VPDLAYPFPRMTELELRRERLRSFWVSSTIAIVPYLLGVVLHLMANFADSDVLYKGVPDVALASVVISIASLTNTIFSFVKLQGWRNSSRLTYLTATLMAVSSVFSFSLYIMASHTPPGFTNVPRLFVTALLFTLATAALAWVLTHTFTSDECRQARALMQALPSPAPRRR